MPSPIIARADALMQRRRQNSAPGDDIPVLTDSINDDDDIPVLVDAEAPQLVEMPIIAPTASSESSDAERDLGDQNESLAVPAFDSALRDIITHELARRIEQRLSAELPRLIEATVRDYLTEQDLVARLQARDE